MAENRIFEEQSTKVNMNKKKSKKKRLLKKSVRRTTGALLLATSLVVAAIPVSVAEADAGDPGSTLPTIESIVYTNPAATPLAYKTSALDGKTLSVKGNGQIQYAFPQLGDDCIRITDTDNHPHEYYQVNTENMDTANAPVAIYKIEGTSAVATPLDPATPLTYGCITKYIGDGGSGHSPASKEINLGARVCYQNGTVSTTDVVYYEKDPETGKFYEIVERAKGTNNTLFSEANPTIKEVSKQEVEFYENKQIFDSDGNPVYESDGVTPATEKVKIDTVDTAHKDYVGQAEYFYACDSSQVIYAIGDDAFKDTANYSVIRIPKGITAVGNGAFYNAKNLRSIDIGINCLSIGNMAFGNCIQLGSVNFDDNCPLGVIGDGAFSKNSALSSIVLPNLVTNIGAGAFYGCTSLNDSIEGLNGTYSGMFSKAAATDMTLGDYAFAASGLSDIHLYDNIKNIGNGTFEDCGNLQHVEMPSNYYGTAPAGTFKNCRNLLWVRYKNNKQGSASDDEFITPSIGEAKGKDANVKEDFAIWGPDPNEFSSNIHDYAVKNSNTYMYDKDGIMYYELTLNYYKFIFSQEGEIKEIIPLTGHGSDLIIPTKIGNVVPNSILAGAYQGDATGNPTNLIIKDNIKKIEEGAFKGCGSLENIEITTEGIDIGKNAFSENGNLKTVHFAQVEGTAGDTKIGERAFYNCPKLENIYLLDDTFDKKSGTYDYIHIVEMGNEALKTYGDKLTVTGPMQVGYAPYDFAVEGNSINSTTVGYITYRTGNPLNLECKYDQKLGGASLTSYPNVTTKVGVEYSYDTDGNVIPGSQKDVTVHDLMLRRDSDYQPFYNMQQWICDYTDNVIVPEGIKYIDKAKSVIETNDTNVDSSLRYYECKYFQDLYDPWYETNPSLCNGAEHGGQSVTLNSVSKIPDGCFENNKLLTSVTFNSDISDLGDLPFYVDELTPGTALESKLKNVYFNGDASSTGTPENPKYYCNNGIIIADDGTDKSIIECLPARGNNDGLAVITADETDGITKIDERAFENCDYIQAIDLSSAEDLKTISERAFYDCDNLEDVYLPETRVGINEEAFASADKTNPKSIHMEIDMPSEEYDIADNAFENVRRVTLKSTPDSAAESYAKRHKNVDFEEITGKILVKFLNDDSTVIKTQRLDAGFIADPPADPVKDGYTFTGWNATDSSGKKLKVTDKLYEDTIFVAGYKSNSSTSSTSTTSQGTTGGGGGGGTTSKTSSSSSSSSSTSSSSTSTSVSHPIILSGANAAATSPVATGGSKSTGSSGSVTRTSSAGGKTNVVSTADGITDVGKMSATVNGSSDNYVVKITQTQEATDNAKKALEGAFGSLDAIRYLPIDISLYDSTGTNKISPIPEGTSVSITMPIPDDLAIYGGNAKVASTVDGKLEKIQPRFTVINSVPCMTFTCTHFSPYVVYVDTANLTATGIADSSPKTADPIHPKWFLCIGLAAVSLLLFLKKDPEDYIKKKARA